MHYQVRFTRRAEADLQQLCAYTLRIWGPVQADRALADMEECCHWLAESPIRGRSCDGIRPNLRRVDEGRYVVFFREIKGGILVTRILHQSMLLERRATDDPREHRSQRATDAVAALPRTG